MALTSGTLTTVRFSEESAYGVTQAGHKPILVPIVSETMSQNINTITSEMIRSDRRMPSVRGGNISGSGDIVSELMAKNWGVFWKHFVAPPSGDLTGTAVTTAKTDWSSGGAVKAGIVIKHSSQAQYYLTCNSGTLGTSNPAGIVAGVRETNGTVDLIYIGAGTGWNRFRLTGGVNMPAGGLTVEKQFRNAAGDNFYFRFLGGRVNTCAINVQQEGMVGVTWGALFQQGGSSASASLWSQVSSSLDYATEPYAGYDVTLEIGLTATPSGRTTCAYVQSATINLTNNFDETPYAVGSRYRRGVPEGRREATGSVTAFFENMTEFNHFMTESELILRFIFVNKDGVTILTLPRCKFTGGNPTPQVTGQGVVTASFDFQAYYQGSITIGTEEGTLDSDMRVDIIANLANLNTAA